MNYLALQITSTAERFNLFWYPKALELIRLGPHDVQKNKMVRNKVVLSLPFKTKHLSLFKMQSLRRA